MTRTHKNMSLLRELMQTKVVMMESVALHNYRTQILHNLNNHILSSDIAEGLVQPQEHRMLCFSKNSSGRTLSGVCFFDENGLLVEQDAEGTVVEAHKPEEDEERILVMYMDGPVTRFGGMCSQGSMDYRDMLLEYANDDSVKGFVLVTDTPGGTAFALHDFEQGMDAWNAAGKFSIQWIDGMSCSAGVACGSQCQKIIAYNAHDIVGCIGAMMAGWATADGTVDSDGNRYIDVTASQTPDKNGEFRAAAAGDYEGLQHEVDECCAEFLRVLDKCRPQVTPEQRTGKTYDAGDVIGTLIDGIGSFDDACQYALTGEMAWLDGNSSEGQQPVVVEDPERPETDPNEPENEPEQSQITLNRNDMNLLQRIAAALGIKDAAEVPATEQTVETPEQPVATVETEVPETAAPAEPEAPAEQPGEPETPETPAEEGGIQNPEPEESGEPEAQAEEPEEPSAESPTALEQQLAAQAAQFDAQITELQQKLQEQVDVNAALAEANTNALAEKDATIATHAAEVTGLNEKLAAKEAELTAANDKLAEQTSLLAECKAELEKQNSAIDMLNAQLAAANTELDELKNTAPACPAPAPAHAAAQEEEDGVPETLDECKTAQEIIACQKKINSSRRKKKQS